jgi:hypothetical protein
VIALSGCAAQDQTLRKPADRTLAAHYACPPPGAAERNQAALDGSRYVDLISSNETQAFGPTRIIWVHPPDEVLNACANRVR